MKLNENGLTARAFVFSRNVWGDFGGSRYYGNRRSDLCTVVRSIFILMPLAYAVNIAALGFAAYVTGTLLLLLWINLSETLVFFAIVIGCILFVTLILGTVFGGERAVNAICASEPARVAAAFYRAKKQSICPMVEFQP